MYINQIAVFHNCLGTKPHSLILKVLKPYVE